MGKRGLRDDVASRIAFSGGTGSPSSAEPEVPMASAVFKGWKSSWRHPRWRSRSPIARQRPCPVKRGIGGSTESPSGNMTDNLTLRHFANDQRSGVSPLRTLRTPQRRSRSIGNGVTYARTLQGALSLALRSLAQFGA